MKIYIVLILLASQGFSLKAEDVYLAIGETHRVATQSLQTLRIEKKGIVSIKDHHD